MAGAIAAAIATGALAVVRVVALGVDDPEALLLPLIAAGLLCVVGLTIRRAPTVAWLAVIATLSIVTIDLAAIARTTEPGFDDDDAWRLALLICGGALGATGAAVGYAADPRRRLGPWVAATGVGMLGLLVTACGWAFLSPGGPAFPAPSEDAAIPGTLSLVTRLFLVGTLGFTGLGLLGDVRPAVRRARQTVAVRQPAPRTAAERAAYALAVLRAAVDEAGPGRARARQAALAERSRIARELHAEVVPAIRRALSEAERDGSVERLAASLREALGEVDALVAARHSVVLEVDGLIPALEALAERIEDRSAIRVTIDVQDAPAEPTARPPAAVEMAAYRIADLALENVVRHAPGAGVRIEARADAGLVAVVIEDDGPGIAADAERTALRLGRRGLADMRAEAGACGAALEVTAGDDGRGTVVRFRWPATA